MVEVTFLTYTVAWVTGRAAAADQ